MATTSKLLQEGIAPAGELCRMILGGSSTAEILEAARHLQAWVEKAQVALAPKTAAAGAVSERGTKFADWFRSTLTPTVNLAHGWREKWGRCFDEMVRLDGRTPEQIAAVCGWARKHEFWRANFQSPLKLRERKDGVMYFDRFMAAMAAPAAGGRRQPQSAGYELAPEADKKVWNPLTDA